MGLLGGAALLVANRPRRGGEPAPLTYRALAKLALVPLAAAAVAAAVAGAVNAGARVGRETAVDLEIAPDRVRPFVVVWAIHAGSYAGALLGTAASAIAVVRRRRLAR
jgi:hypothetical protein